MSIEVGSVSEFCKIDSILPGSLRGYSIVKLNCNSLNAEVDIPNEVMIFKNGEEVKLIISRERPEYSNRDFCAHGYIFYEKKDKEDYISLISLYGLLVKITTKEGLISSKKFNMMDHIYFCLKH